MSFLKKAYAWSLTEVGRPAVNLLAFLILFAAPNIPLYAADQTGWYLVTAPLGGFLFASVVCRGERWGTPDHKVVAIVWSALAFLFFACVHLWG
jgi:hypothetical protein